MTRRSTARAGVVMAVPSGASRAFRITVTPGREDTYGIILEETYGQDRNALATLVTSITPAQTGRVVDTLFAAIRGSGHAPSALAFTRRKPIHITEPEGVRLALILLATQPVVKHDRVRAIVAGINTMSVEETYYWYAKCIGVESSRALKAIRILLTND